MESILIRIIYVQFAESGRVPTVRVRVESESACLESESESADVKDSNPSRESESSKIGTRVRLESESNSSPHLWQSCTRECTQAGMQSCMGPFNYYVTLFLANFDPPPPCHKVSHWSEPPYPRNVTLVCRPGLKPVMLKQEYIITSKIL